MSSAPCTIAFGTPARRAPPDLIEQHQGTIAGVLKDVGGFRHLHHEGGLAGGQIIHGPHPGEDPISDAVMDQVALGEGERWCFQLAVVGPGLFVADGAGVICVAAWIF